MATGTREMATATGRRLREGEWWSPEVGLECKGHPEFPDPYSANPTRPLGLRSVWS